MRLSFPLLLCGKNGQKVSENILKSEVVFKCTFVDLNMIKITGGLFKNVCPVVRDNQILEKNGQKISENTLEYYQKSEIVLKCLFVIRNDLNMMKINGGLIKLIAQLSGKTKFQQRVKTKG